MSRRAREVNEHGGEETWAKAHTKTHSYTEKNTLPGLVSTIVVVSSLSAVQAGKKKSDREREVGETDD